MKAQPKTKEQKKQELMVKKQAKRDVKIFANAVKNAKAKNALVEYGFLQTSEQIEEEMEMDLQKKYNKN